MIKNPLIGQCPYCGGHLTSDHECPAGSKQIKDDQYDLGFYSGMTQACIQLRVPESGIPRLDALIRAANRREIATALRAQHPTEKLETIFKTTDALIAALDKKEAADAKDK